MHAGEIVVFIAGIVVVAVYIVLVLRALRRRRERRGAIAHPNARPQAMYDKQTHLREGGRGNPGLSGGGR